MSEKNRSRRLIWVPIVHTQADLGTMGETVRQLHLHRVGRMKWNQYVQTVEAMWADVHRQVEGLNLRFERVRLYQDGLPNCGRELEIVRNLAQAGSRNHQILLELVERGARLVGTESPELLLEEYELAGSILESLRSGRVDAVRCRQQRGQSLLEERDRYIAARIDQTLGAEETGLIFLGLLHSLEGRLPPDIEVVHLTPSLPRIGARGGVVQQRRPSK